MTAPVSKTGDGVTPDGVRLPGPPQRAYCSIGLRRPILARMTTRLLALAAVATLTFGGVALADDHIRNGLANGKPNLGQSNPFCVPGGGSPNDGLREGTPSASDSSCRQDGTVGRGRP